MFSDIYYRLLLEIIQDKLTIRNIPKLLSGEVNGSDLNPVKNLYILIKIIYEDSPESNIGLEFGRLVKPINACDFSRLVITSEDVSSAFKLFTEQYPTLNLKPFPIMHRNAENFTISLIFPYEKPVLFSHKRFCSESFFSFCLNVLTELVSQNIRPLKLYLDYPKPKYSHEYNDIFNCEVIFDAPLSMIVFDNEIASQKLSSHNAYLHEVYLMKAMEQWKTIRRQQSFQYRTLTFLLRNFPKGFNSQYLAQSLNISTRGLQKRLSAEGSSFSLVSQQVRRELIKICMFQMQYDLDETARCLGFQTQVSFRKFFKQHLGDQLKVYEALQQELYESTEAS